MNSADRLKRKMSKVMLKEIDEDGAGPADVLNALSNLLVEVYLDVAQFPDKEEFIGKLAETYGAHLAHMCGKRDQAQ